MSKSKKRNSEDIGYDKELMRYWMFWVGIITFIVPLVVMLCTPYEYVGWGLFIGFAIFVFAIIRVGLRRIDRIIGKV